MTKIIKKKDVATYIEFKGSTAKSVCGHTAEMLAAVVIPL